MVKGSLYHWLAATALDASRGTLGGSREVDPAYFKILFFGGAQ